MASGTRTMTGIAMLRKYGNFGSGHPNFGAPDVNIPGTGIHARNWPYDQNNNQDCWTDSNGQWHQVNQNNQGGWTDANEQQNQGGWTDANDQWHANQKRDIVPGVGAPDHYDNYCEQEEANHHQEHEGDRETAEDVTSALLPGPVVARNYPQHHNSWNNSDNDNDGWNHNVPQANPVENYNDEAHDDDHHNKDHHEDKGIDATDEKLE
ncbi:hypothetical protein PENSUB_2293 [Penicillium subrubescens]|uniref:Uncharacterized protein n=1 Tax=Penicillium subrubescens TaxID=1316194 RepID=A0A1Q5UI50_9EURO|nr:hypothetical protein PENSUB_2293 [Penicillium subrubescens]